VHAEVTRFVFDFLSKKNVLLYLKDPNVSPLYLQMSKYSHQQCSLIVMSISVLIRKSNVKVYRTDANK